MRPLLLCLLLLFPLGRAETVTVFAASSLGDAFRELAAAFEASETETRVLLDFAGSSTLATQILQGAPADVFASADERQMERLVEAGLALEPPAVFALNRLALLVPIGGRVRSPEDLAVPGTLLVLAAPEVPAGRYAREALAALAERYGADYPQRVLANLVSEEPNVRQVAAKVALGEADAAIVYATDGGGLAGVETLPIPDPYSPIARYPIVRLGGGEAAARFVAFVRSDAGRELLARYGFALP